MQSTIATEALWSWRRLDTMQRERVERYFKLYANGTVAGSTAYEVIAKIAQELEKDRFMP